jgi:hypothetical protein
VISARSTIVRVDTMGTSVERHCAVVVLQSIRERPSRQSDLRDAIRELVIRLGHRNLTILPFSGGQERERSDRPARPSATAGSAALPEDATVRGCLACSSMTSSLAFSLERSRVKSGPTQLTWPWVHGTSIDMDPKRRSSDCV